MVRASILVTSFLLAGHGLNYGLYLVANRLLSSDAFGVFFAAISAVNVLVAAATFVVLLTAQHFSQVASARGEGAVAAAYFTNVRRMAPWALVGLASLAAALLGLGTLSGVQAPEIAVLVALIAFAEVLAEVSRSAWQAMRQHFWFGGSWVAWMAVRLVACVAPLAFGAPIWVALAGMLVATLGCSGVLAIALRRRAVGGGGEPPPFQLTNIASVLPVALAYGLVMLLVFCDVLMGYVVLDSAELGHYSASVLLPKAILIAAGPILQVLVPVLAGARAQRASVRIPTLKALVLSSGMAAAGAIVISLLTNTVCGTRIGLKNCAAPVMISMLWAVLPLVVLRVLVVARLAAGSIALPLGALFAALGWLAVRYGAVVDMISLVAVYAEVAWFGLLAAVLGEIAMLVRRRRQ